MDMFAFLFFWFMIMNIVFYYLWFITSKEWWWAPQDSEEKIIFYPTVVSIDPKSLMTEIPVHGHIFHPKHNTRSRRLILKFLTKLLKIKPSEIEVHGIFHARAQKFLVANRRGKLISVRFPPSEMTYPLLSLTNPDGHTTHGLSMPTSQLLHALQRSTNIVPSTPTPSDDPPLPFHPTWLRFESVPEGDQKNIFSGSILLVPKLAVAPNAAAKGNFSVISDIDDTIKDSFVADKRVLMRNTFLKEFKSVTGMSKIYQQWQLTSGAIFHYVSGSPWQLYEPIMEFVNQNQFPMGGFYFRNFRSDSSILKIARNPSVFKLGEIEDILRRFPDRCFVCVGDSGEKDPEVYSELCRKFPGKIKYILIRRAPERKVTMKTVPVPGVGTAVILKRSKERTKEEMEEEEREEEEERKRRRKEREDKRWETVFGKLPKGVVWRVFDHSEELEDLNLMEARN